MATEFNRSFFTGLCLVTLALTAPTQADEGGLAWPRELLTDKASIVLFQPQPETLQGDALSARAAVSVTPKDGGDPAFGSIWLSARMTTDRDQRTASLDEIDVARIVFPSVDADQTKALVLGNREVRFDQQRLVAELQRNLVEPYQGHGGLMAGASLRPGHSRKGPRLSDNRGPGCYRQRSIKVGAGARNPAPGDRYPAAPKFQARAPSSR